MDFKDVKGVTIIEGDVTKITVNGEVIWEKPAAYKNWVPYSIDTDGSIYNGGLGYKDYYRLRSGGAESALQTGTCTGFIPLKIGDTLRIYPAFTGKNVQNAINFFDENFTNLGQQTDSGAAYGICQETGNIYKTTVIDGVSTLTLTDVHDATIRYVRITNEIETLMTSGSQMIVTVNEEIT